jgi:prevent-host-death family protein
MNIKAKTPTTFTSREFNQNTAGAKRAAEKGPVFITDRGKPVYVLMSIEEYRRLEERKSAKDPTKPMSLAEALEQKDGGDFDFDFPEFKGSFSLKPPEFD